MGRRLVSDVSKMGRRLVSDVEISKNNKKKDYYRITWFSSLLGHK